MAARWLALIPDRAKNSECACTCAGLIITSTIFVNSIPKWFENVSFLDMDLNAIWNVSKATSFVGLGGIGLVITTWVGYNTK